MTSIKATLILMGALAASSPAQSRVSICQTKEIACRLAKQAEQELQTVGPQKIAQRMWLTETKAHEDSIVFTIESTDLLRPLIWDYQRKGQNFNNWLRHTASQMTENICGKSNASSPQRKFLAASGHIIFSIKSLDNHLLGSFKISHCVVNDLVATSTTLLPARSKAQDNAALDWENKKEVFLLMPNEFSPAECEYFPYSSPAAPWGNRQSYEELSTTASNGRWMARTALYEDGTRTTIFHFMTQSDCKAFSTKFQ